jgi:hypothetical protein
MPSEAEVFSKLPFAEFRGERFPISGRTVRHAHEVAKTIIQYFGKQLAEIVNGDNLVFEYTIPFRNGVSISPYRGALFNEAFPAFWRNYINTEVGPLVDPFRGEYQVLPGSWEEMLDLQKTDGLDVRIMFVEAPTIEGTTQQIATVYGATSDALALDSECSKIDWQQEEPPQPSTDPLSAVAGIMTQVADVPGKIAAKMYDTSARLQKIEDALTRLEDPKTAAAPVRAARTLRLKSNRLALHALSIKPIRSAVNNTVRTVAAVAAEVGMSVEDFLKLNSALARSPLVPIGAVINYREQ